MMNSLGSAAKTLVLKPQSLLLVHPPPHAHARGILSSPSIRLLRFSRSASAASSPSSDNAVDEQNAKPKEIPSNSYWLCERAPIFEQRSGLEEKTPRAVRWDLQNISRSLLEVDLNKIDNNIGSLESGLYLVATPIGNLEDITLRALRVLKSADVILAEDTRHSGKLLQYYNIKTPLLSFHKFNESQREATILRRLQQGQTVALISDAGTPGISDPGAELAKLCVVENIPVIPIPGPSALVAALSASGLPTNEFTFVGFLPKHAGSRRDRLLSASNQTATQLFYVPPHKLQQFLNEALPIFGESRLCVIARELTKLHEEFWRGSLAEANKTFSSQNPKGEITVIIEGKVNFMAEVPSESQLEHDLRALISNGHSISTAVKLVAEGTTAKRKHVYALALRLFGKHVETEDCSD